MDKETLSNYGWIVICVLVLAVMLALATPLGNFISTAVKSTTQGLFDTNKNALNSTGLINIGGQSFDDGASSTDIKREAGSVIPDGATYTPNGGTAITGNGTNKFPDVPAKGDTYEEGDYIYKYNQYYNYDSWSSNPSQNGWGVRVKDTSKTTYGEIISEIAGQPVNTMRCTFRYCTSLTTAPTIPNSVTNMFQTFTRCTSLTTAPIIPNSVTNMDETFWSCTKLTTAPTIPNSVTSMESTFIWCTSLTTAPTIPNSVTNMESTFSCCTKLTTAPTIPNSVTDMQCTFYDCSSLKTYVGSTDTDGDFSNYSIPNSVTNMAQTFQKCTSITTAPTIPSGVTNMSSTFNGCTSLITAPTIPNSVTDMFSTFQNCTSLTTAPPAIPNSVTEMTLTFCDCTSLKTYVGSTDADGDFSNYTIPNSVTSMRFTFYNCTSLTTAPVIPSGVTNVYQTFNGCTSLTGSIEVNGHIDISNTGNYGMFIKNSQITEITGSCSDRIKSLLLRTKTEDYPW